MRDFLAWLMLNILSLLGAKWFFSAPIFFNLLLLNLSAVFYILFDRPGLFEGKNWPFVIIFFLSLLTSLINPIFSLLALANSYSLAKRYEPYKVFLLIGLPSILPLLFNRNFSASIYIGFLSSFSSIYSNERIRNIKDRDLLLKELDKTRVEYLSLRKKNLTMRADQETKRREDILEERNRIAKEIHDNVGHDLTGLILQTSVLCLKNEEYSRDLKPIVEGLNSAMDKVRKSIHDIHDESLDLKADLEKMAEGYAFCPVYLTFDLMDNPPSYISENILSISREALSNSAKHSNASRIDISIIEDQNYYSLLIVDNGDKFEEKTDRGLGLISMEDRVYRMGGRINITNNKGFRIHIQIPKMEA